MKCFYCPVPDPHECASVRHARYCTLAATRPEYLPVILKQSLGGPAGVPMAITAIPVKEAIAAVRAVRDCLFRETAGCGCGGKAVCRQFAFPITVNHLDCMSCPKLLDE